jgi:hypothetical protein
MTNFEKLLDITFPVVERLMEEYGEFYPLATAIKNNNEIVPVATFYEEEYPKAAQLLEKLKEAFIAKKNDYKAFVICYNGKMIHPETRNKTDVIVFIAEDKVNDLFYHFYYPYSIVKKAINFGEPWKSEKVKEIFK